MLTQKRSRIIAALMLLFAAGFVCFAAAHPTAGFPWDPTVTYTIYTVYLLVMAVLFAAPWGRRKPD